MPTSWRVSIRMKPVSKPCARSSAGDAGGPVVTKIQRSKSLYNQAMQQFLSRRMLCAFALALTGGFASLVAAQAPAQQPPPTAGQQQPAATSPPPAATARPAGTQQREVIRRALDIITTDVIVRDNTGQFVADLKKDEFEVYEDGVKQDVQSFVLIHGGRTFNQTVPEAPRQREGIILPASRPTNDAAGRIFIIFVDDLHLDFRNTGRIRDLFKKISTELVHDGDMFSVVSTGPSSIEIPLNYDRRRLDEAMKKIAGNGLKPQEILDAPEGADGPAELKYRAHVAFSTAYDMLRQLEQVHNRRKAFIYISNGYDFNPFADSRQKAINERYQQLSKTGEDSGASANDSNPFANQGNRFAEADLVARAGGAHSSGKSRQCVALHDRSPRPRRRSGSR